MLIDCLRSRKSTLAAENYPKKSPTFCYYAFIRILLSALFIWSGITKSLTPQQFAIIIESYGIMPDPWVLPTAICLSIFELLVGIGLLFDMQWALGLITALLVLFMVVLGYGLWMGLDVDCGCFGPNDPEGEAFHGLRPALYRDGIMLAAAVSLFWVRWQRGIRPLKISTWYNHNNGKGDEIV